MQPKGNTGDGSKPANNNSFILPETSTEQSVVPLAQESVPPTLQQNIAGDFYTGKPKNDIGDEKHPLVVRVIKDDDLSSFEKKTVRVARWGVGIAVASLLAAIGAGVAVYRQFTEMAKQTGILSSSLEKQQQDSVESSRNTSKQLAILGGQLSEQQKGTLAITNQMRQDQRPWLRVEFEPTPGAGNDPTAPQVIAHFTTGQPIDVPVRIRNTGKTPAESIIADFIIQIVQIDEPMMFPPEQGLSKRIGTRRRSGNARTPPLDILVNHIVTGVIFPDTFSKALLRRAVVQNGQQVDSSLTLLEGEDILKGAMIYATGRITYTDEFGASHWTDFCRPLSDASGNARCAKYNAVDSNQ